MYNEGCGDSCVRFLREIWFNGLEQEKRVNQGNVKQRHISKFSPVPWGMLSLCSGGTGSCTRNGDWGLESGNKDSTQVKITQAHVFA